MQVNRRESVIERKCILIAQKRATGWKLNWKDAIKMACLTACL